MGRTPFALVAIGVLIARNALVRATSTGRVPLVLDVGAIDHVMRVPLPFRALDVALVATLVVCAVLRARDAGLARGWALLVAVPMASVAMAVGLGRLPSVVRPDSRALGPYRDLEAEAPHPLSRFLWTGPAARVLAVALAGVLAGLVMLVVMVVDGRTTSTLPAYLAVAAACLLSGAFFGAASSLSGTPTTNVRRTSFTLAFLTCAAVYARIMEYGAGTGATLLLSALVEGTIAVLVALLAMPFAPLGARAVARVLERGSS